jgi:hypothetical protein
MYDPTGRACYLTRLPHSPAYPRTPSRTALLLLSRPTKHAHQTLRNRWALQRLMWAKYDHWLTLEASHTTRAPVDDNDDDDDRRTDLASGCANMGDGDHDALDVATTNATPLRERGLRDVPNNGDLPPTSRGPFRSTSASSGNGACSGWC